MRSERVRFADFEADLASGELWRQGKEVKVRYQPFRFLELLTRHAGDIVSYQEIDQALWPGVYSPYPKERIKVAVKSLRRALQDDEGRFEIVECLPKRGYRLRYSVAWEPTEQTQQAA